MLLTDDKRNRQLAIQDDLVAISTKEYVDGLEARDRDRLVDLVVGGVDDVESADKAGKRIYPEVSPTHANAAQRV